MRNENGEGGAPEFKNQNSQVCLKKNSFCFSTAKKKKSESSSSQPSFKFTKKPSFYKKKENGKRRFNIKVNNYAQNPINASDFQQNIQYFEV